MLTSISPMIPWLFGIFIITPLSILGVYLYLSSRYSRNVENLKIVGPAQKHFLLRYRLDKNEIRLYRRDLRLREMVFSIHDFLEALPQHHRKLWESYLEEIESNRFDSSAPLIINFSDLLSHDVRWVRISFFSRNNSNIYFQVAEISRYLPSERKQKYSELQNAVSFVRRVSEQLELSKNDNGAVFCFNYHFFETITRRYGAESANQYLLQVWHNLHSFNDDSTIVAHYSKDYFVMYQPKIITRKQIEDYIMKLSENLQFSIDFDGYHFDANCSIGVALLGEFDTALEANIQFAIRAADRAFANGVDLIYYDASMEEEEKARIKEYQLLLKLIDSKEIKAVLYPVISLQDGDTSAYIAEYQFPKEHFQNFGQLYDAAVRNHIKKDLFLALIKAVYHAALSRPTPPRVFVFLDLDIIETMEEYLKEQDERPAILEWVVVITAYETLIQNEKGLIEKLDSLRKHGALLGVVADEMITTVVHPLLFSLDYLVFPATLTYQVNRQPRAELIIDNILSLIREKNIVPIAWNIVDYAQAEILKDLGVMQLNGPLFDNREERKGSLKYSVRRISKLIDEATGKTRDS